MFTCCHSDSGTNAGSGIDAVGGVNSLTPCRTVDVAVALKSCRCSADERSFVSIM